MTYKNDTIAAIATPPGYGGIGVIRISGKLVKNVATILLGKIPYPRKAEYLSFFETNNIPIDKGIAIFFPSPHSFTGEDILELHGHGGPVVLDLILKNILSMPDIRIARPGEFSERAFINNKIDLTQAEAISDLIYASSNQAARLALQSLQGIFSTRINEIKKKIIKLRSYIESAIDFSNEDIEIITNKKIQDDLNNITNNINTILNEAHQGSIIREGTKIVITGKPNSGKSSLINKLTGKDIAIVTNIPGTTRDLIQDKINLNGIPINIIDTAGLRHTKNSIEQIGIEYALREIKQADHILFMVDGLIYCEKSLNKIWKSFNKIFPLNIPITIIRNKIDLTNEHIKIKKTKNYTSINMSVKYNNGIDTLYQHIKDSLKLTPITENSFLARRRHIHALEKTLTKIIQCKQHLVNNIYMWEFLAEDLRLAQKALNEITGEFTSNNLIEEIFSNFCIGK